MKVLSLLQYCCMLFSRDDSYDYQSFYDNVVSKCSITERAFYSQVFKPQLITELFECFTKDLWDIELQKEYQTYFNHKNKIRVDLQQRWIEYSSDDDTYTDNFYPRTLDDFITDCQRAGIELIWKESGE